MSLFASWLLGFTAGFAGGLYFGVATLVALIAVLPVFVAGHRILAGAGGVATGLGLISLGLGLNPPDGCSNVAGCSPWLTFALTLGGAMTTVGIAVTAVAVVRSAKRQPRGSMPELQEDTDDS